MTRFFTLVAVFAATAVLGGCVQNRCCPRTARAEVVMPTPPTPKPARASAWYHGDTGKPADMATTVAGWKDAEIVAFGELHGNLVGAAAQLRVLEAMHAQGRPIALAMEFMERDTQPAVDAYLAGKISTEAFKLAARQNKAYDKTHGPLVEFCKANGIPIIAANAPRRLVSGYRKQDEDYETYVAGLPEEDRAWLPEETSILEDAYRERFMKMMGEERGTSFFRSQSLWDDAMAEAMYDFRSEHPDHRILFIVGGFHVERGLGTISKYKLRRGKDDIRVLIMDMDKDPQLPFRDEDMGKGDLILKVPYPKRPTMRKMPKASGPNPHLKKPTKSPHARPKAPKPPDA
jgi:uncharacterized iron-regulated protein